MKYLDTFDLAGRNIAVTGCTSGIGSAVARVIAGLGAHVACLGRDEAKLAHILESLDGDGHRWYTFNSAAPATIEAALVDASRDMGPLHGAVHAAGVCYAALLRDAEFNHIDDMMAINFMAFMALSKAMCRRGRYAKGSSIVAISSYAAFSLEPWLSAYSASKAALNAAVVSLAREYAPRGIRFNAIAPSYVNTRMLDSFRSAIGSETFDSRVINDLPLGLIEPEDIATCAAFLLSDSSSKMTGAIIPFTSGCGC